MTHEAGLRRSLLSEMAMRWTVLLAFLRVVFRCAFSIPPAARLHCAGCGLPVLPGSTGASPLVARPDDERRPRRASRRRAGSNGSPGLLTVSYDDRYDDRG